MEAPRLTQHLRIVGWFDIASSLLFVAAAIFVFTFFAGMGIAAHDPEALPILSTIGVSAAGFLLLVSLPGLLAGWGLLNRKPWARILGIVVAILFLFAFPIGTAIGIYALWVLSDEEAVRIFEPGGTDAPTDLHQEPT